MVKISFVDGPHPGERNCDAIRYFERPFDFHQFVAHEHENCQNSADDGHDDHKPHHDEAGKPKGQPAQQLYIATAHCAHCEQTNADCKDNGCDCDLDCNIWPKAKVGGPPIERRHQCHSRRQPIVDAPSLPVSDGSDKKQYRQKAEERDFRCSDRHKPVPIGQTTYEKVTIAMASSLSSRRSYPSGSRFEAVATRDGWPLRSFEWPATGVARGSILFQGGRGDIIEKYLEVFDHWHRLGWNISAFDWRGQGGSGRLAADAHVGHCVDFGVWVDDLAEFVADWTARAPGPHVIMGHSMGGHLVLRALAEKRILPDAAVLVAPMLGFETGALPLRVVAAAVRQFARFWPERAAWKVNERPAPRGASRQKFLTSDVDRYNDELWWKQEKPELELGPPSLKWLEQAYGSALGLESSRGIEEIRPPVLLIGTFGDQLVSPSAIPRFADRIPNATLKMFDASVAHEILRERDGPRDEAIALIDALLEKVRAGN